MSLIHPRSKRSVKVIHFSTSALASVMAAVLKPEAVDPFTEHANLQPLDNMLDQATFDPPIPEDEKPLVVVPRRIGGAENTHDA